jgi:hypothetical protein
VDSFDIGDESKPSKYLAANSCHHLNGDIISDSINTTLATTTSAIIDYSTTCIDFITCIANLT